MENVKNLVGHDNGNTFRVICEQLELLGYHYTYQVLNAMNYGNVAQNRERIYIVAFRDEVDYEKFHWPLSIPLTHTVKDIIDFDKKVEEIKEGISDLDREKVVEIAKEKGYTVHVGNVLSEDSFYKDDLTETFQLAELGVLGVEMEAAALYYLGAKYHVQTLSLMTVSDHLITGEETTAAERQSTFNETIEVGLETAIAE